MWQEKGMNGIFCSSGFYLACNQTQLCANKCGKMQNKPPLLGLIRDGIPSEMINENYLMATT